MDTDSEGKHFIAKRIDFIQANSSPEALYVRFLAVLSAFISVHPWFQLSRLGSVLVLVLRVSGAVRQEI